MIVGVVLALLTAASNATSNVLQRIANRDAAGARVFSAEFAADLLRRKVWLAGFGLIITSFLLQAAALHFASLAAVQPIVVLELPLTLIIASLALHSPLHRREWVALAAMSAGVAILLAALTPHGGATTASGTAWVVGTSVSLALLLLLAAAGRGSTGARRAALYGGATGVGFGLTAAFTTTAVGALSQGVVPFLTSWQTYAMAASGLLAMYLTQLALHAGRLIAAQPGITILDPVTSILWGTLGFGATTNQGAWLVLAVLGGALLIAGAVLLSRSPLLEETNQEGAGQLAAAEGPP